MTTRKSHRVWGVWGLCAVLALMGAQAGWAQDNEECMACHDDPDLMSEHADGTVHSAYINTEVFGASVHADMDCVMCHGDIEELPHASELASVDCGMCHDDAQESYASTLHGHALKQGDGDVAVCHDCHGKHDIRHIQSPLSKVHPKNQPDTCGRCHSDPGLVKSHMISVRKPSDGYLKSVHAKAILGKNNLDAASCSDCHGSHSMLPSHDPNSNVYRLNIPRTCGQCHSGEYAAYQVGIHGMALAAGIKDAPTCVDCHDDHEIELPHDTGGAVSRQRLTQSACPKCHSDEEMMERYGLKTRRAVGYMDSFHEMANLPPGMETAASCSSCHGTHTIYPSSDPKSATHPDNLPDTCGQCHENAGPHFAQGLVHVAPTDPDQKILGIVRLLYLALIAAVIGGMVMHNTLIMARHALVKFRAEMRGPGTYGRFTRGQTFGHLILTVSFILLCVSGFALRYPMTWWVNLIFPGDTGLVARGMIHRGSAMLLIAVSVANAIYLIFTRHGRKELVSLMFNWRDVRDIFHNLGYIIGICKKEPRWDRYSYIEKFEYWGMWWGTLLMIVTGFCMMYVNVFLQYLPKLVLDVIALIHFYEAWLAILTIIVWHLFYMILDPHTYPMNWSWITGHITEEDFKDRHPLEYERVQKERMEAAIKRHKEKDDARGE